MTNWNVVVTVREGGFDRAFTLLAPLGEVAKTEFYNTLVMRVEDHARFTEAVREMLERDDEARETLSRVVPAVELFGFQTPEEFDEKARLAVTAWIPSLAGKGFHVRMRRRGFKGKLSSLDEERFLDEYLMEALKQYGSPASLTFQDPDAVVAIETVGNRAGVSFWTRDDLLRYPFLSIR